jgi:hypothetical protein
MTRDWLGLICVIAVRSGGASERSLRRIPVLATCVAGVLALCAGVAQAEPPRLVSYGTFSSGGAFGAAVDQSSGDVYVAGLVNLSTFGQEHVNKFDFSGRLLSPPSPFGEGLYSGAAVDPTNGDVYVLGEAGFSAPATVYTYDPNTGAPVGTPFEVPASRELSVFFTTVQIAADSAGNVYVPVISENEVREYSPAGVLLNTFTGSGALKEPTGVAVDSSGNLWVADHGDNRIEELTLADTPVPQHTIASEGVLSVALDGHGHVFAIVENSVDFCGSLEPPCAHLIEYSSAGAQLADVGAGNFGLNHPSLSMLAVNESSDRVYVTDVYNSRVSIFGPPTAPLVSKELTAEVTASETKLGALINPGGIQTTYRFEYGTGTAYGHSTPFPEGSVGEGIVSHAVWAAASGLEPGTTYHYRVVATNELAPEGVAGEDHTFTTLTAEQAACPNEALRGGFSARLPDCRAYELVTQPTKTSVESREGGLFAASGDAVAFKVNDPLPGAVTAGAHYLATRGAGGWSSEDLIPLESYSEPTCQESQKGPGAYSAELSEAIIAYGRNTRASFTPQELQRTSCNAEGLQVVPGEPVGYENLLLRDNATGSYRLINTPPPGVTPADAHLKGASADLSHVVFTETAPLAEGAAYGVESLYEWDEGAVRLLSVLPTHVPVQGSLPAVPSGANAISTEGSHILFTHGGALYDRIDGERTVQVDESNGGPGASGGGSFQAASVDGAKVFFLDASKLTADSTAQAGEPDLYECVLPEGASKCELRDLTAAKAGEPADVLRVSVLGSQESSHLYFLAKGVLATNKRQYTGGEGEPVVEEAKSGEPNLYLWDEGTTTFIATLTQLDSGFGQTSPNGTWFAFDSVKSLSGYENTPSGGAPAEEIFLYSAASNQLVCVSCNPSGEAPIPFGGANIGGVGSQVAPRYLSDGGRIFFQTPEALVPSDTNGRPDVYEYEDGHVYLVSSGTSTRESLFLGAGESGADVFFRSSQALVPQDTLEGMDAIYDARVGGGFPASVSPPACTTADACRTPVSPQPAIFGEPSSQTFSGAGNLAAPAGKTVGPKSLTRKQKLARALGVCHKQRNKRKRSVCERQAKGRYGAKASPFKGRGKANASKRGGK